MNPVDLSGPLALVGGVSGAIFLVYASFSLYYARQKAMAMREIQRVVVESLSMDRDNQLRLAKIEGVLERKR